MLKRAGVASAGLFALAALPAVIGLWGFSVDDARISVRVAENLAEGYGYRFNRSGPVTDAVTPLGWAPLLSLVAGDGMDETLLRARWLGAVVWIASAALLGGILRELGRASRALALITLAVCVPLGAWAVSGMETPWVTLLAVLALVRSRWAAAAAGAAAAWRPELLPWALTLAVGGALAPSPGGDERARPRRVVEALALAVAPAVLFGAARWVSFGTPVPLAAVAKPSDFSLGLRYVLGALCLAGPPWLLLGSRAYRRLPVRARVWLVAFAVHCAAVLLAGGDWMSFYRLFVPVLPSVIAVGALLQQHSTLVAGVGRAVPVLFVSGALWWYQAADARAVSAARAQLIETARPLLGSSSVIAGVDIGWLGAAAPEATIVDLAGVTDPTIAPLPGGHTTKRVPSSLLVHRDVDTLVLLLADHEKLQTPWYDSAFHYGVDALLGSTAHDLGFEPVGQVPLPRTPRSYVVLRRGAPYSEGR